MRTILVCLNYNTKDITLDFINRILDYKSIDKIVLVDNVSTDGSYEAFKSNIKNEKVDILNTGKNLGFAGGNNFGLVHAKQYNPDILIVCNTDIIFDEELVIDAIKNFEDNPKIGLMSYKCIFTSTNEEDSTIGEFPKSIFKDYWEFIYRFGGYCKYGLTEVTKCDYVATPMNIFNAKAIYEAGMYDQSTFLYGEERIIGYEIHRAGYDIIFDPRHFFYHMGGASTNISINNKQKLKYWLKSRRIYWFDHIKINSFKKVWLIVLEKIAYLSRAMRMKKENKKK